MRIERHEEGNFIVKTTRDDIGNIIDIEVFEKQNPTLIVLPNNVILDPVDALANEEAFKNDTMLLLG